MNKPAGAPCCRTAVRDSPGSAPASCCPLDVPRPSAAAAGNPFVPNPARTTFQSLGTPSPWSRGAAGRSLPMPNGLTSVRHHRMAFHTGIVVYYTSRSSQLGEPVGLPLLPNLSDMHRGFAGIPGVVQGGGAICGTRPRRSRGS